MGEELDGGLRPGSVGAISEEEGKFPIDSFSVDMGEKTDTPLLALSREWNFEASRRYYGISGAHTVATDDGVGIFGVTTGASDFGVALPGYAANNGRTITIVKVDSGAGEVTISGGFVTMYLNRQYQKVTVVSNGSVWLKLDGEPSYISGHISMGGGLYSIPVESRNGSWDITNFAETSYTEEDWGSIAPAGVKSFEVSLLCRFVGDGALDGIQVCTRPASSSETDTVKTRIASSYYTNLGSADVMGATLRARIDCDPDGKFDMWCIGSGGSVYVSCLGYWMGY